MSTCKKLRGFMAVILALVMCIAMLPTAAFAAEADKTLTVDASATEAVGETYTTIQDAINYINSLADDDGTEDGWTITVAAGDYARFTVLNGVDDLTVQAAEGATVTISTMDGSTNPATVSGACPETDGVSIRNAQNVTLEGLTFTMGTTKTSWVAAAVSNYTEQTQKGDNFTVKNCTFQGSGTGYAVFVNTGTTKFTVTGCSFDSVYDGIEMFGDGTLMAGASVTYNTFTNSAFAMHGYYGGTGDAGTLTFAYNTVTGTSDLRCKVVVQDQNNTGALKVDVHDNTFTYGLVGLVNLQEDGETVSDVLSSNTFDDGSFYVEAVEPGSVTVTYASYQAPSDDTGYWVLTGIENSSLISYNSAVDADILEAIQDAIDAANATGSHTLNITSVDVDEDGEVDEDELIRTFTWCKDAIYWVSGTMPTEKVSEPGLDKVIVLADGTEVDQDDVAAGDTVNYKLTSNVPSNLNNYIDYTGVGDNTNVVPLGTVKTITTTDDEGNETTETVTYTLTFHDEMDNALSYNGDAKVTLVTYELDEDGNVTTTVKDTIDVTNYATITTDTDDECDFEVSIDLLELYADGKIEESDFGSAEVVVTFSATLSEEATAGAYYNTAWVSYLDETSEKDTVEVDTYKLSVFKYDQSDGTGLAGAKFTVYSDEDCTDEITTITTGTDGYAYLDGLDAGTYYLKETEAPSGYVKADTVLTVTIPTDVTDYVASVSFANAPIPSTGGAGTTMYTIAGICILLAAGAIFVISRKKREV